MRRSFVKGQNGARSSPDVKVSEEQSDKSGTDPEDTDENHSQADITDYRHYEEIFRYGYYTVYLWMLDVCEKIGIKWIENFLFLSYHYYQ